MKKMPTVAENVDLGSAGLQKIAVWPSSLGNIEGANYRGVASLVWNF